MKKTILEHLKCLNLVNSHTNNFNALVDDKSKPCNLYIGFDPTADSLHTGSLLGIITALRLKMLLDKNSSGEVNHSVTFLIGDFTAAVGDPSGKSAERNLMDLNTVSRNAFAVSDQLKKIASNINNFLSFDQSSTMVNQNVNTLCNREWFDRMNLMQFLVSVGKHFRVNTMLTKDSVKQRLDSESGISFTEFSYSLLQAFDFAYMAKNKDINLQIGGSDQWGNIVSGIDLAKKIYNLDIHGLTFNLLTDKNGRKFGKTEAGAVWLSEEKTSAFDFYNFWFNTADSEVENLARQFLILSVDPDENLRLVEDHIEENRRNTSERKLQKLLAETMTVFVHGRDALERLKINLDVAFNQNFAEIDINSIRNSLNIKQMKFDELVDKQVYSILPLVGLTSSKTEGRNAIKNNSVSINDVKVTNEMATFTREFLAENKVFILKKGKKQFCIVEVENNL